MNEVGTGEAAAMLTSGYMRRESRVDVGSGLLKLTDISRS